MAIRKPKIEKRLLGAWKSDKKATLSVWKFPPHLSRKKRRYVENQFGKLIFKFTSSYFYSDLDGFKSKNRYRVVAADDGGVVLAVHPEFKDGRRLHGSEANSYLFYIEFFDDKTLCIMAPGNVEYFKRVTA